MTNVPLEEVPKLNPEEKKIITIVYVLQMLSFLLPITMIAAIIVNYLKRGDIHDPIAISHMRWQIRTFWFALLWSFLGMLTLMMGIGYFIFVANAIWVIYRIAKGWLALSDNKALYISTP